MKQFIAEAPGKVILLGEHFVVHDGLALAATIGKSARVTALPSESDLIESTNLGVRAESYRSAPASLKPLFRVLDSLRDFTGSSQRLYLKIESGVPVGQGLGSSGCVSVAFTAAATAAMGHILPRETVAEFAMQAEKEIHQNPSGIDVYIPTFGGLSKFRKGELPQALKITKPIQILLAYSGKKRRTKLLIKRVSKWRESNPQLFEAFKQSVESWVNHVAQTLERGETESAGGILSLTHGILQSMGASTPQLDRLVNACLAAGCHGAKLTGGGGGGAVFALPPSNTDGVITRLNSIGFQAEAHTIPMGGLKVWSPKQ